MRVIAAHDLRSFDSYEEIERPLPQPGKGEVRVQVAACGVGYVDALVALGRYQVKPALPHVPGVEISGTVDALGAGDHAVQQGDRVLAFVDGGFADYVLAKTEDVARLPANMSFPAAAGLALNYLTALHGLRDRGRLKPGEKVLVFGAAGGLGLAAVQIAKVLGAEVIAVASDAARRDLALKHGADFALDREPEGWRARLKALLGPKGLDVVFDPACGQLFEPAFRSLGWGGQHLVVGFIGGPIPALSVSLALLKGAALVGVDARQFRWVFEAPAGRSMLAELLSWVRDGKLSPPVGRAFPFSEFREALTFAYGATGTAKTVLTVDDRLSC